jgi:hypothetical protein
VSDWDNLKAHAAWARKKGRARRELTLYVPGSDFVLLFFSGVGLIAIAVVSVVFLYRVGQEELPGTLSSVSGNGLAGAKRD